LLIGGVGVDDSVHGGLPEDGDAYCGRVR